jgi:hypothetical protein
MSGGSKRTEDKTGTTNATTSGVNSTVINGKTTGTTNATTLGTTLGTTTGTTSGTTKNVADPYALAKPGLDTALRDALGLYKTNSLDRYVGPSAETKSGLAGLLSSAKSGKSGLAAALGTFTGFAGGGGSVGSGAQTDIAGRAITAGGNAVGTGAQTSLAGKALAPSYSEANLAGVARGDLLNADDPNFEHLLSRSTDAAALAAKQAAGARGRYGGDYAADNVTRAVGDIEAEARYKRLTDERSRQVEANSLMDQQRQAGLNTSLNASNSASSIDAGNLDRILSGLGLGLNASNSATSIDAANRERQLSAAGQVPAAYDATLKPSQTMVDVGRTKEADLKAKADVKSNNLQALLGVLGAATPYGTSSTTSTGKTTGTSTDKTTQKTVGTTNATTTQSTLEKLLGRVLSKEEATAIAKQPNNLLSQILGGGLGLASLLL